MKIRYLFLLMIFFFTFTLYKSIAQASNLSIEPVRQEIVLKAGEAFEDNIRVRNNTSSVTKVKLNAEFFDVINENYDYDFIKSESISDWINFSNNEIKLKPGQVGKVNYSVGSPINTEPGEKYIAIFASTSDRPTVIERAGLLLYITTPGEVTKRGNLLSMDIPKFSSKSPIIWQARINSSGNAHFKSPIIIEVKNLIGQTVGKYSNDHLILPSTVRRIEGKVSIGSWPGLYKVKVLVGLGDNPTKVQTKWVLYTPPLQTLFLLVIFTLILIAFIKYRSKIIPERLRYIGRKKHYKIT